jgi:ketosteroid isomerase-like protein
MAKTASQLTKMAERLFDGWNRQDVEAVVACYTEDLVYLDPNTRGAVRGAEAMRRYLGKLFGRWEMHWSLRELFPLADADGAAALWHASFRKPGGEQTVEADGMDLVLLDDDRVKRNEVYFDRAVLAPLMGFAPSS